MFTDSHCHLNFPELRGELHAIREAMATAQVTRALCICTTIEEFPEVHSLATEHSNFWSTVGVHPDNEGIYEPTLDDLVQRSKLPKVVAIGETGLDYYDMAGRKGGRTVADMQWQRERFRTHIRAARQTDLPLIIHTRSASEDTISILKEEGGFAHATKQGADTLPLAKGVFHCFTENMAVAKAALDLDFYISFSGILTFKAAQELRDVAAYVPLERCLIETDSPYLAPTPYRGKTNNPSYVPFVAKQIAQLKGISVEAVAHATSENFDRLFPRVLA
ncbi:TatD family hydrolase [Variovorax sp. PCZ-1]|uniref:TatD family hydrolase n=1 Tax=Variovorax sp. PCZ-1 TaxID=2835533 RepID=UPI001BD14763|nr:TatD family hydrolase [Variovorax sp. PCZ-1]MBS7807372.1 TatD family hydrolase [Variovorax sp. PCZ-1]